MTIPHDRMPPLTSDQMTAAQRKAAEEIVTGRRGHLIGPFVPALRSPELTRRLQRLGEYLRFDQSLEPRLREMAILLTARQWTQQFEWYVHAPLALAAGVAPDTVAAIAAGRRPAVLSDGEAAVWELVDELHRRRAVSDGAYERALRALGEQGIVDLVALVGYYTTLAMIMNVAQTPLPVGERPALEPL